MRVSVQLGLQSQTALNTSCVLSGVWLVVSTETAVVGLVKRNPAVVMTPAEKIKQKNQLDYLPYKVSLIL